MPRVQPYKKLKERIKEIEAFEIFLSTIISEINFSIQFVINLIKHLNHV